MPDDLGLTERDKELAKWNKPYRFEPFPKMLYRGRTTPSGRLERDERIVGSEAEEKLAAENGWHANPDVAVEAERKRQEDRGTAAAERAYADLRMSAAAQAEAAAIDSTTAKHLPEIPEQPKRSHHRKE